MKNEIFVPSDELVTSLYNEFLNDETIISISALRKKHGYGSKSGAKIQRSIYTKYGERNVKKICLSRCSKHRRSKITGTYRPSEETLKKRSESIKKSYINNVNLIEIRRQNAYKTIVGRTQTEEEKQKRANSNRGKKRSEETKVRMSLAKKGKLLSESHRSALIGIERKKVNRSYPRSEETKQKLSAITKQQWKDGVHTATYRSKGQIEVEDVIKSIGYDIKPEFLIEGRPYDTFVLSKNLLIEVNGTVWHRDPRFYKMTDDVKFIHQKDAEKINLAKKCGYDIIVIWQHDWEQCTNKEDYIKNIFKNHGK